MMKNMQSYAALQQRLCSILARCASLKHGRIVYLFVYLDFAVVQLAQPQVIARHVIVNRRRVAIVKHCIQEYSFWRRQKEYFLWE